MNQPVHTITEEVKCSSCANSLVGLWIVPNLDTSRDAKETTIRCQCCYCEDKSFVKRIEGEFYMHPAEGLQVTETQTLEDGVVLITLEKE